MIFLVFFKEVDKQKEKVQNIGSLVASDHYKTEQGKPELYLAWISPRKVSMLLQPIYNKQCNKTGYKNREHCPINNTIK